MHKQADAETTRHRDMENAGKRRHKQHTQAETHKRTHTHTQARKQTQAKCALTYLPHAEPPSRKHALTQATARTHASLARTHARTLQANNGTQLHRTQAHMHAKHKMPSLHLEWLNFRHVLAGCERLAADSYREREGDFLSEVSSCSVK